MHTPEEILANWLSPLGVNASIVQEFTGRDLWLIHAMDGTNYYLKKYGPWRNLPLADEYRLLRYLDSRGIRVGKLMPTDSATLFAGDPDESFVLIPQLKSSPMSAADVLISEEAIGRAVAKLHVALSNYPGPIDSYTEDIRGALASELMLPLSLAQSFAPRRAEVISTSTDLPTQLIHGDLTPGNIIMQGIGDVSGFIDFDHLPMGPRIWDIAKYLSRRLRMNWRRDDPSATYGRTDHIAPFLRGYQSDSPLSVEELAALPALIAAGNVIETSYFMEISSGELVRRKLPDHDEVLADSTEAAEWQLSHWDNVVDAVESTMGG